MPNQTVVGIFEALLRQTLAAQPVLEVADRLLEKRPVLRARRMAARSDSFAIKFQGPLHPRPRLLDAIAAHEKLDTFLFAHDAFRAAAARYCVRSHGSMAMGAAGLGDAGDRLPGCRGILG